MAVTQLATVKTNRVLNVGGGSSRSIPAEFDGWTQHLLDIDPSVNPDIVCDALKLETLEAGSYDAVFCSHNLEHFYQHDVPTVLRGFLHVLEPDGQAVIVVPSLTKMLAAMAANNLDIGDVWYRTGEKNAITFHDVLYGWNPVMAQGNLFYAHKCGFTQTSLGKAITEAGFAGVHLWEDNSNLYARAYKGKVPCQ